MYVTRPVEKETQIDTCKDGDCFFLTFEEEYDTLP